MSKIKKEWLWQEGITTCPIKLDEYPQLCSALTCTQCQQKRKKFTPPLKDYWIDSPAKSAPKK